MFKIQVRLPNGHVTDFTINKECVVLGRAPDSDIFLPGEQTSRHHAKIYRSGEQIFIEDENSSNGTFVKQERIKFPTPITVDDPIKLGDVYIRVSYESNIPTSKVTETGEYSIAQRLGDRKKTVMLGRDLYQEVADSRAKLQAIDDKKRRR